MTPTEPTKQQKTVKKMPLVKTGNSVSATKSTKQNKTHKKIKRSPHQALPSSTAPTNLSGSTATMSHRPSKRRVTIYFCKADGCDCASRNYDTIVQHQADAGHQGLGIGQDTHYE